MRCRCHWRENTPLDSGCSSSSLSVRAQHGRRGIDVFLQDCSQQRMLDKLNVNDGMTWFLSSSQKNEVHVAI